MGVSREDIAGWVAQGRLRPEAMPAALRLAGIMPARADWRAFIGHVTLWTGTASCAAAVVFFFAYNWAAMSRFAKFGLAELLMALCLGVCWRVGLQPAAGKAALTGLVLLTGALLALVGQTYQTGADTWELFAVWAAASLPLVILGQFNVLWLVWIALANVGLSLFFRMHGTSAWGFGYAAAMWATLLFNAIALACWEAGSSANLPWLRARWPAQVLATAVAAITVAVALKSFASKGGGTLLLCLAALGLALLYYRTIRLDLYVLALNVLGVIVLATAWMVYLLLDRGGGDSFIASLLVIALSVLAMSAAGGSWLRQLARKVAS